MNVAKELAELSGLGVTQLRGKYLEVFGEETRAGNKAWLLKRIAWRIQALAEGDLSERARQRAQELANDADIRLSPPRPKVLPAGQVESLEPLRVHADPRLPPPGTVLIKSYKGRTLQVLVLEKGFEYEGQIFRSLSAVAKTVSGTHINGFLFFGLARNGGEG